MKLVFAIKDNKIGTWFTPSFANHETELTRGLQQVVNDERTNFNKFPRDFELYNIGKYDEKTGILHPENPQFILTLSELMPKDVLKEREDQLTILKEKLENE